MVGKPRHNILVDYFVALKQLERNKIKDRGRRLNLNAAREVIRPSHLRTGYKNIVIKTGLAIDPTALTADAVHKP